MNKNRYSDSDQNVWMAFDEPTHRDEPYSKSHEHLSMMVWLPLSHWRIRQGYRPYL